MMNLFRRKKDPINKGDLFREKDKEFLGATIEILEVGEKNALIRFVFIDGIKITHEWSFSTIRSLYRRVE